MLSNNVSETIDVNSALIRTLLTKLNLDNFSYNVSNFGEKQSNDTLTFKTIFQTPNLKTSMQRKPTRTPSWNKPFRPHTQSPSWHRPHTQSPSWSISKPNTPSWSGNRPVTHYGSSYSTSTGYYSTSHSDTYRGVESNRLKIFYLKL